MNLKEFLEYILNFVKIWVIVLPWENAIRVRMGKSTKILNPGIYFKLPYFDSVFVQEIRLRIADMPIQTVTTKDAKTISIAGTIGYSIIDIKKLYDTLYHPETSIRNIALSNVAKLVYSKNAIEINPNELETEALNVLCSLDYGIRFEHFRITNFALVRTYRLIQDTNWGYEGLKMNEKR